MTHQERYRREVADSTLGWLRVVQNSPDMPRRVKSAAAVLRRELAEFLHAPALQETP